MTDTPKRSPRMTADEIEAFLTDGHTGILTTLRRDGVPIAMPLWYVYLDGIVYTQTRGKKLGRIAHDPRSSFLVETGARWAELKAVHLTGVAEEVALDGELGERFAAEFVRKYAAFQTAATDMPVAAANVYQSSMRTVRFVPEAKRLNWDNAKLIRPTS